MWRSSEQGKGVKIVFAVNPLRNLDYFKFHPINCVLQLKY